MQPEQDTRTLVNFFKALAHETRLKLIGYMAEGEYSVGALAAMVGLKEPTVSHHLAILNDLGLLTMRADKTTHYYKLDTKALEALNKTMLTPERAAKIVDESGPAFEAKVMAAFTREGRITAFPASFKKYLVLLRWLVEDFEFERRYAEKEVNEIISRHHEDYATTRRDFVELRFMARDHGIYWRLPREATDAQIELVMQAKAGRQS